MAFFYRSGRSTAKSPLHLVAALTLAGCFGISTWSPFSKVMAANAATAVIWLSVDTSRLRIAVMRGDTELQLFENIAIGSNGPSKSRLMGDDTTPLGDFTITEIRHSERFELFMAFDYPNLEHTERAFEDKRIDEQEYRLLRYDLDRGNPPPQGTSLGGYLGIHGIGDGDLQIHESFNWTDGCIAITNEQLMDLADWVTVGTRVNVH
ncbi:MAG: L,D-transpeptidase [Halioglobus sp.]|nr:L,D-transpeptidase [Halioglobus sp.]